MKIEDYKELFDAINELENKTNYCAFFNYSGHVKWADFSVSLNKEKYDKKVIERFCLQNKSEIKKAIQQIHELIDGKYDGERLLYIEIFDNYKKYVEIGVPKSRAIKNVCSDYKINKETVLKAISYAKED